MGDDAGWRAKQELLADDGEFATGYRNWRVADAAAQEHVKRRLRRA